MRQQLQSLFTFRALLVSTLVTLCLIGTPLSEVRSGTWLLLEPSSDTRNYHIDFSELRDTCSMIESTSNCPIVTTDCHFNLGKLIAPYGVCYDSVLSTQLETFVPAQQLQLQQDNVSHFYLDSMMKRIELEAPEQTYVDSLPANKGAYFIKTSENKYALLLKKGEYIGGYNRTWYYWIYQSDGSRTMKPEPSFTTPEQLALSVISDSEHQLHFSVKDETTMHTLIHLLHIAVIPWFDSSLVLPESPDCSNQTKITVHGMFQPYPIYSSILPEVILCNGTVTYRSSSAASTWLRDPDNRLLKAIVTAGCRNSLISTDSSNVQFCNLFSDSLRTPIENQPQHSYAPPEYRPLTISENRITCHITQPQQLTLDLFTLNGRHMTQLYHSDHSVTASFSVSLQRRHIPPGVYLLRLHNRQNQTTLYSIPLTLAQ